MRLSLTSIVSVLILLAAIIAGVQADQKAPVDQAIQTTILAQIEAFAIDDREQAWTYASQGIKEHTGSIDNFYRMVQTSYQAVYRASAIEFRERIPHHGFQIQVVHLQGPEGKFWQAIYRMEQDGDDWRIGGVMLHEAKGTI